MNIQSKNDETAEDIQEQINSLQKKLQNLLHNVKPTNTIANKRQRMEATVTTNEDETELEEITLESIESSQGKNIELLINGTKQIARVDSGCEAPLMGLKTFSKITERNPSLEIEPCNKCVVLPNQQKLPVIGKVNLQLSINNNHLETDVIILETDLPFYLDYQTMGQMRLMIDPETHRLVDKITGSYIPLVGMWEKGALCQGISINDIKNKILSDTDEGQQIKKNNTRTHRCLRQAINSSCYTCETVPIPQQTNILPTTPIFRYTTERNTQTGRGNATIKSHRTIQK